MARKGWRGQHTAANTPEELEALDADPIFSLPDPEPAVDTEVIYFDDQAPSPTGDIELRWMTMEELTAAAEQRATPHARTAPQPPAPATQAPAPTPPTPQGQHRPATPRTTQGQHRPATPTTTQDPAPVAQARVEPTPAPPAPPAPAPTPSAPAEPAATVAPPAAASPATAPPAVAAPGIADASSQIAELLQAAHESAARLQAKAKSEVQASIDAALADVESRRRTQVRELEAARTTAEHRHAEIIHNAQLRATETRTEAAEEAARIRAAAEAVLAQAKAEVQAVQALAHHNLAEIEAAKEATAAQATELIGRGKDMLLAIQDLDEDVAARLIESRQTLALARQAAAERR